MAIADINLNGHTYTDAMWRANWEGTISDIANDIAAVVAAKELVGTTFRALAGDTTLSAPESTAIGFVFSGVLANDALVTWAAGFQGPAHIENACNFALSCGLASGDRVLVPAGGSATVLCDGARFILVGGIAGAADGARVPGVLTVAGLVHGLASGTFDGNVGVGGTLAVTGAATFAADVAVTGGLNVTGALAFTGLVTTAGAVSVGDDLTVFGEAVIAGNLNVTGVAAFASDLVLNAGTLRVSHASTETRAQLAAPAGMSAWMEFDTSSSARWLVGRSNDIESGGGGGSNFHVVRHNDAGVPAGIPLIIRRADGVMIFGDLPTSPSGLPGNAIWKDTSAGNVLKAV